MPGYTNPQSLNRYSYVNNSPLNYTDPSGHVACQTHEDCLDMGTTPGGGYPAPQPEHDNNDQEEGDFCDLILGCENPDAGIFCDHTSCWYDASVNISGTTADPAIYLSLAAGGWASGLVSDIGWLGLYNCLRVPSCARIIASTSGLTVYRVWGGNPDEPGINYSGPYGASWTPIPPNVTERLFGTTFRSIAGLPDINNTGRFLSTGTISDISVVSEIQSATPISPNAGGLLEYIIFNAQNVINLTGVQGNNPPF